VTDEKMVQAFIDFMKYGPEDQLLDIWDRPPTRKRRKPRKMLMSAAIKRAKALGMDVTVATDGSMTFKTSSESGNANDGASTTAEDELAQWRKGKQNAHSS
jgi:hypothetical protein